MYHIFFIHSSVDGQPPFLMGDCGRRENQTPQKRITPKLEGTSGLPSWAKTLASSSCITLFNIFGYHLYHPTQFSQT